MKKMKITAAVLMLLSFSTKEDLVGRWQTKPSEKGTITSVNFKADKSFEGFVNRKPFVTGNYDYTKNILSFTDNGCNGARGVYKVDFFSNGDSLRFVPVTDSCEERKQGMTRLVMGRIKAL